MQHVGLFINLHILSWFCRAHGHDQHTDRQTYRQTDRQTDRHTVHVMSRDVG